MEPKWNVKSFVNTLYIFPVYVLMEPKWNVKDVIPVPLQRCLRINGTKVECKVSLRDNIVIASRSINGTKVECKVLH